MMRRSVTVYRGGDLFSKMASSLLGEKLTKNTQLKEAAIKTAQMSQTVDVSSGFRALLDEVRSDVNSLFGTKDKQPEKLSGKNNQDK